MSWGNIFGQSQAFFGYSHYDGVKNIVVYMKVYYNKVYYVLVMALIYEVCYNKVYYVLIVKGH